jgi:hypothetical protein
MLRRKAPPAQHPNEMEISETALRRLVGDVDDQHRAGLATLPADLAELHHGEGRRTMAASRRQFLQGVGLGGLALTIGPAVLPLQGLLSPAAAATAPKLTDEQIAAFAESLELAAVAGYAAAASKVHTPAVAQAAATFSNHHSQHATAFAAMSKGTATGKANPKLVQVVGDQLRNANGEMGAVKIAYDLENAAAATYLFALGALAGNGALQLTASILPVESQHAVVLGQVLGLSEFEPTAGSTDPSAGTGYVPPFVTTDLHIDPVAFPVASGS